MIHLPNRRTVLKMLGFAAAPASFALDKHDAPVFSATTLDERKFTAESLKGSVVLIQFWTTWCGYCRRDEQAVEAVTRDFAGKGLVVLAVNVGESKKKVRQYLKDSPRSCNIVLTENTNLAAVFAARSFPFYVALDKQGKVAGTQNGAGGESALLRLLEKAGLEV